MVRTGITGRYKALLVAACAITIPDRPRTTGGHPLALPHGLGGHGKSPLLLPQVRAPAALPSPPAPATLFRQP